MSFALVSPLGDLRTTSLRLGASNISNRGVANTSPTPKDNGEKHKSKHHQTTRMTAAGLFMAINPNKTSDHLQQFGKKNLEFGRGYSCNNTYPMRLRPRCSLKLNTNAEPQFDSTRRSGMYKPTLWGFDHIQSLNSVYTEEKYSTRAGELILQVKKLLEESDWFRQLQLIDDLDRLGLSYRFDDESDQILNTIYLEKKFCEKEMDLYSTSLAFRLLRQHGLKVSQEVFDRFKNEEGDFEARLGDETDGVLELYEASFLSTKGEDTLEVARLFSTNILQKKLDDERDELLTTDDNYLRTLIRHSLDIPLHWRVRRPSARWFIDAYAMRSDMNPIMLELAKLDFNIVQATHQEEAKQVSRWWKESRLAERLPFARDRIVENYMWNTGMLFEPQYGFARIMNTKVFVLITVLDDVYDVYATPEEIHLFTDIITRWDIEAIDQLPEYMQISYMAIDNVVNEMAYEVLKEHGVLVIQYLRKVWADLFKMYAKEAEWYYSGYKPTLAEYLEGAWISIGAHLIHTYMYFLISNPIVEEASQSVINYNNVIRCSAMILRLADDIGTSTHEIERGDVLKAVECYMNENGASREEAREHVQHMLRELWKETNEESFKESPFTPTFLRFAADLGRMSHYMYQHGDGHGVRNPQTEERIRSLIFDPIV